MFRIPYAKVIRWKPPIDLASEMFPNGSFHATSFGPCCPQSSLQTAIYIPMQDEQCLYLNIYKPIVSSNHSLLPVFVWIHGGGLQVGCSSQSIPLLYNGTNMIAHSPPDQPVIIVTLNYRLGVLGNMYLKELTEENPEEWPTAGNYFYLDMLSALRWINKNIQDYGGDPSNVSIFGESAGGQAAVDLGAVKGSTNLYRTATSESGPHGNYFFYYNMSMAVSFFNKLVQQVNCTNDDKQKVVSCLRNTSIENLLTAYGPQYKTKPIIDNYFFPLYPSIAIKNGTYNKNVNLIMGNNDYEQPVCFQRPDMNFNDALSFLSGSIEQKWIPLIVDYFHLNNCSSNRNASTDRCCDIVRLILIDRQFNCNVRRIYNALYLKYGSQFEYNKLFWYHLNCHPGTCPLVPVQEKGICEHTAELPYVFGTTSGYNSIEPVNCTWDNQSRLFSNKIIAHWMNIATTGKPLEQWPNYDPLITKYYYITPDQDFSPIIWNRNCSVFDQIEEEEVLERFGNNTSI